MSNRSLVEINHDYCPPDDESSASIAAWGYRMRAYLSTGDRRELPAGVELIGMRHHTEKSVIEAQAERIASLRVIIEDACGALGVKPEDVDASGASDFQLMIQAGVHAVGQVPQLEERIASLKADLRDERRNAENWKNYFESAERKCTSIVRAFAAEGVTIVDDPCRGYLVSNSAESRLSAVRPVLEKDGAHYEWCVAYRDGTGKRFGCNCWLASALALLDAEPQKEKKDGE